MSTNCNIAPLTVHSNGTITAEETYHLYRRAGFGISPEHVKTLSTLTPEKVVDDLVDYAVTLPPTPEPPWAHNYTNANNGNGELKKEWRLTMFQAMHSNGLRDRLMLFWSNHFVTEVQTYICPSYWYDYINILQRNCLGNLKVFVHEIGLSPAMLVYLNGNENQNNGPNENYARELFELFTLGEGIGYTQTDIEETAKALTGYTARQSRCAPFTFNKNHFNSDNKTIFGRTGNWGYDDVIDILFEERPYEIAQFIVQKLYRYFVNPELPKTNIIYELAAELVSNAFELEPVIRKLFKSQHFFDLNARSVIIKSPMDLLISFYNDFMMPFPVNDEDNIANAFFNWGDAMGQRIFDPPNVAGWTGDKIWINSSSLLSRWRYLEVLVKRLFLRYDRELLRDLVISIVDDPAMDNVEIVCRKVVETYLPSALLSDEDYQNALEIFKSRVPENYFEDGTWSLYYRSVPVQMRDLLLHIVKQPEFQLK